MKQKITIILSGLLLCFSLTSQAQERYLDEVFSEVEITDSVIYSINYSILPWILTNGAIDTTLLPLYMDVYTPSSDTVSERPLLLFGITGTFFPAYVNGGFVGERSDTSNIRFATEMAKKGYVVAVVQYRRGWLAGASAILQQKTILHAAYRGIQDMRTAVRYFKANSDFWGIDTTRIGVGGQGTGAYMSYGASYLKRYDQTLLTKFIDFTDTANPQPFLNEAIFGDPYGVDPAYINNPNFATRTSDFRVGFGLGGALGDLSWVEQGDVPFISMHSWKDPGQPYDVGDILAVDGTNGQPFAVIPTGAGGKAVVSKSDSLGNQAVFKDVVWKDPYNAAAAANSLNDSADGLYTFITPFTPGDAMCDGINVPGDTLSQWGSTWIYYDSLTAVLTWNAVFQAAIIAGLRDSGHVVYCQQTRGYPNIRSQYDMYMDTVMGYLTPRLAVALDLPTSIWPSGVNNLLDESNVSVFPNPSNNRMMIEYVGTDVKPIKEIKVMDISGRIVKSFQNVNSTQFEIQKEDLSSGLYLLQIKVGDRFANKKIVFN